MTRIIEVEISLSEDEIKAFFDDYFKLGKDEAVERIYSKILEKIDEERKKHDNRRDTKMDYRVFQSNRGRERRVCKTGKRKHRKGLR